MVKLVDAPDSKSGSARSVGSIPTARTINFSAIPLPSSPGAQPIRRQNAVLNALAESYPISSANRSSGLAQRLSASWAGFTESLAYELDAFNIKARLIPPDYESFAQACVAKMGNYPAACCTEAVFSAATDDGDRIRYPAGADSRMLAELRWEMSEDRNLAKMREMFSPA